jgi:hypothetical protein
VKTTLLVLAKTPRAGAHLVTQTLVVDLQRLLDFVGLDAPDVVRVL